MLLTMITGLQVNHIVDQCSIRWSLLTIPCENEHGIPHVSDYIGVYSRILR